MKRLTTAELRHKVEIRRADLQDDGKGGYDPIWSPIAAPFAKVEGYQRQRGDEEVINSVLQGETYYRVSIRFRDGIRASDQLRYGAIDLNIAGAYDPDGGRHRLTIIAHTGAALATE